MSLLLFSPSIDNLVLVVCPQFSPPRLVYKLFAGGKKCNYLFLIFNKILSLLLLEWLFLTKPVRSSANSSSLISSLSTGIP